MLRPVAKVVAQRMAKRETITQNRFGVTLKLSNQPKGLINGLMVCDMTKTWNKHGIHCSGLNFFTLGDIENGLSTRYKKNSPMYQMWLGAYLVEHKKQEWTPDDYLELAVADQQKWLSYYRYINPKMVFEAYEDNGQIKSGSHNGRLYYWHGNTFSDVGKHSNSLYSKAIMEGMAALMNKQNPNLQLVGNNFVPGNNQIPTSYESILLEGYCGLFKIKPGLTVFMYVAAVTNNLKKSTLANYLKTLQIIDL